MSVFDKIKGERGLIFWRDRFVVLSVEDGPEDWQNRIGSREAITYHDHRDSFEDAVRARDYRMTEMYSNSRRRWMIARVVDVCEDEPRAWHQATGNNGSCPGPF
jgi:hypothetical protein